ncbi:hypothetical protein V6N13_072798 [Hibiscus sabdariffa]
MNPSISLSFDGAGEFNCGFASRNDFNHKSAALVWPRPRLTKVRKPSNGKVKGAQGRFVFGINNGSDRDFGGNVMLRMQIRSLLERVRMMVLYLKSIFLAA